MEGRALQKEMVVLIGNECLELLDIHGVVKTLAALGAGAGRGDVIMTGVAVNVIELDDFATLGGERSVVEERGNLVFGIDEAVHAEAVCERKARLDGDVVVAGFRNGQGERCAGRPDGISNDRIAAAVPAQN